MGKYEGMMGGVLFRSTSPTKMGCASLSPYALAAKVSMNAPVRETTGGVHIEEHTLDAAVWPLGTVKVLPTEL